MRYFPSSVRPAARLAGLLLGASLAACQSNSDKAATVTQPTATSSATSEGPSDSPGAWYRQYRGVLSTLR